jgi:FtsP/CotA-like multicopper oxidase with cupredoxin domain
MARIIRRTASLFNVIARGFQSRKLRKIYLILCSVSIIGFIVISAVRGGAQTQSSNSVCSRPIAGSIVNNPPEIWHPDALHPVELTVLNRGSDPNENCYLANDNMQAPTLRIKPGEANFVVKLNNQLPGPANSESPDQDCQRDLYDHKGMPPSNSTNLHFHGLSISPICHQDEVVKKVIRPNESFEYSVDVPKTQPPGLYWYHPHVHMLLEEQMLSGLTGAIIVEGIGAYNQRAAQLPERVFVLRDMKLSRDFPASDTAQPANDISINSVPIRYQGRGQYDPPAVIQMEPNQEQFWRIANTAADTFFDLQVIYDGKPQPLELVARDGVPINTDGPKDQTQTVQRILLPPASRVEFILKGPGANVRDAKLLTLNYQTGTDGDNAPQRTIARIDTQVKSSVPIESPESKVESSQIRDNQFSGLSQLEPRNQRLLYFSQTSKTESNPEFYITVEPNKPQLYNPHFKTPDITVEEGTVEDWLLENRTQEVHDFHIHQIHFLVMESTNADEIGMILDTINVPAWNGDPHTPYPKVKLRMDFRGIKKNQTTSIAGTFFYHCHIAEHEDGGMMAPIRVIPSSVN